MIGFQVNHDDKAEYPHGASADSLRKRVVLHHQTEVSSADRSERRSVRIRQHDFVLSQRHHWLFPGVFQHVCGQHGVHRINAGIPIRIGLHHDE